MLFREPLHRLAARFEHFGFGGHRRENQQRRCGNKAWLHCISPICFVFVARQFPDTCMNEGAVAICLLLGVAVVLWVVAVLFVFGYPIPRVARDC
jgi:hypothetical protein